MKFVVADKQQLKMLNCWHKTWFKKEQVKASTDGRTQKNVRYSIEVGKKRFQKNEKHRRIKLYKKMPQHVSRTPGVKGGNKKNYLMDIKSWNKNDKVKQGKGAKKKKGDKTNQDGVRFANSPKIDFVILPTSD